MTRSALAEELWSLLNEKPQTKRDVVHVLIQIRKVIEHDGKPAKYEVLEFFCDWVAHPKPELEHLEPCDCSTSNCRLFTTSPKVWTPKEWCTKFFRLICSDQGCSLSLAQRKMTFRHDGRKMTLRA